MDFSSPTRALQSLPRRRPALPDDILQAAQVLLDSSGSSKETKTSEQEYLDAITTLVHSDKERWEGLAVGLLLATEILVEAGAAQQKKAKPVYIDGPRVPEETKSGGGNVDGGGGIALTSRSYSTKQVSDMATLLYEATLKHLEHNEPRIRTFVAKAVGAHATWSVGLTAAAEASEAEMMERHESERNDIYHTIIASINEHIARGRDNPEKYSKSSTGALDDTTGWRALETNWQCVACWIASLGSNYFTKLQENDMETLLSNLEYSAITHVNRHVRAAAIAVLEQLVVAAGNDQSYWPYLENGALRTTVAKILKAGLADNWSQVRMAASVLNRVFWSTLQETCQFPQ